MRQIYGGAYEIVCGREPGPHTVGVDERPILEMGVAISDKQVEDGAPHHLPQGVVVLSTVGEGREGLDRGLVLAVPRAEAPEPKATKLNVVPAQNKYKVPTTYGNKPKPPLNWPKKPISV